MKPLIFKQEGVETSLVNQRDRKELAEELLPKWLEYTTESEKKLLNYIYANINYYSKKRINDGLVKFYRLLKEKIGEDYLDTTLFTVLKTDNVSYNSSVESLVEFKMINSINRYLVFTEFSKIFQIDTESVKNLVFIDDFLGTGNTVIKFFEENKKILQGKLIFLNFIHVLVEGLAYIQQYFSENNIACIIEYINSSDKAFNDLTEVVKIDYDCQLKNLSSKRELKGNYLGYRGSAAMVSFQHNTPNNTLAIIWTNTPRNAAIYPRLDQKRPQRETMRQAKNKRRLENYTRTSIGEVK